MVPNRYEQYMDFSGMVNETTHDREFVTAGGVCVLPETSVALRDSAAKLPKWGDATFSEALIAADLTTNIAITAVAVRLRKDPVAWEAFWTQSKDFYRHLAQGTKDPKGARFTKAANVLKYMLFGDCSAALFCQTVKRVGHPTVKDSFGHSAVQLKVVCDTEIQGSDNIDVFHYLWQHLEGNQSLIRQLDLSEHVSSVIFATEQEEPLLNLADHIAGAIQFTAGGNTRSHSVMSLSEVEQVARIYASAPSVVVEDSEFQVPHEAVFGNTKLWKRLWPDA